MFSKVHMKFDDFFQQILEQKNWEGLWLIRSTSHLTEQSGGLNTSCFILLSTLEDHQSTTSLGTNTSFLMFWPSMPLLSSLLVGLLSRSFLAAASKPRKVLTMPKRLKMETKVIKHQKRINND